MAIEAPENQIIALVAEPRDPTTGDITRVTAATHGFGSGAIDTLDSGVPFNHVYFPALMSEAFNYEVQEFPDIDPAMAAGGGGRSGAGVGEIALTDPAGELDDAFAQLNWDACRIIIRRGRPDPLDSDGVRFGTWQKVAALTTDRVLYGVTEKRIRIRDRQATLYETALLDTYDGTGGLDGDAALKGQPKPQAYGRVFNIEPKLINAAKRIYQWHDREVQAVSAIRDGINAYAAVSAATSEADLLNDGAAPGVGQYRTYNQRGMFRLGSTPALSLRLDGQGDAAYVYVEGASHGYDETRASIARRIVLSRGPNPLVDPFIDPTDLDRASIERMEDLQPAVVGFYFPQAISIGAALDVIMAGCLGFWRLGLAGLFSVDQLSEPEVADYAIDWLVSGRAHPEMVAWSPPRWRTRVGWRHNWAPQTPAELGAATASQQQLYGEEWTYAPHAEPSVQARHPMARDPAIAGNYVFEADAQAEAERQQLLCGVRRERWRLSLQIDPFADLLGKVIEIRGFDRYGLGSRLMRVVGIQAVSGLGDVTLDVWG